MSNNFSLFKLPEIKCKFGHCKSIEKNQKTATKNNFLYSQINYDKERSFLTSLKPKAQKLRLRENWKNPNMDEEDQFYIPTQLYKKQKVSLPLRLSLCEKDNASTQSNTDCLKGKNNDNTTTIESQNELIDISEDITNITFCENKEGGKENNKDDLSSIGSSSYNQIVDCSKIINNKNEKKINQINQKSTTPIIRSRQRHKIDASLSKKTSLLKSMGTLKSKRKDSNNSISTDSAKSNMLFRENRVIKSMDFGNFGNKDERSKTKSLFYVNNQKNQKNCFSPEITRTNTRRKLVMPTLKKRVSKALNAVCGVIKLAEKKETLDMIIFLKDIKNPLKQNKIKWFLGILKAYLLLEVEISDMIEIFNTSINLNEIKNKRLALESIIKLLNHFFDKFVKIQQNDSKSPNKENKSFNSDESSENSESIETNYNEPFLDFFSANRYKIMSE